jgi:hypothetical protein
MQTAELMADYIDYVLKVTCLHHHHRHVSYQRFHCLSMQGKMKDFSEEDTWTCMDNVVALFAHLQEKDVFRTFHSELLAKRSSPHTTPLN